MYVGYKTELAQLADHISAPIIGALISHITCHYRPPASLSSFAATILLCPLLLSCLSEKPLAIWVFTRTITIYLTALVISIVFYRLSPFHPLAKYPGPVLARISRFWAIRGVIRGHQHMDSHELFNHYADIVRTGPNHLLIRNAGAVPVIHGPKDRWPRHARSQVLVPYNTKGSLVHMIDPVEHSKRRRLWDRAFTPGAIKSYEPMLQKRLSELVQNLNARSGSSLDLGHWLNLFSFDFMGDFAFGGRYNMMSHGRDIDGIHDLQMKYVGVLEALGSIPWIRPLVLLIPAPQARRLQQIARNVAEQRRNDGSQTRDLFYHLLREDEADKHRESSSLSSADLGMEAFTAINGGSDTTAAAMTNFIYFMISHPSVFRRLRAELDAAAGSHAFYDQALDPDQIANLKYLQAVLNETLRLLPAVPNGIQRTAPSDQMVAGHYIPAGTNVQIPIWSIHRDPRYFFPDPEAFWPERWLSDEGPNIAKARGQEFRLFHGAYMPFHYGPANCVGRSIALHEASTALARLVRCFDFEFAPGFVAQDYTNRLRDRFILQRGPLNVVITQRKC